MLATWEVRSKYRLGTIVFENQHVDLKNSASAAEMFIYLQLLKKLASDGKTIINVILVQLKEALLLPPLFNKFCVSELI